MKPRTTMKPALLLTALLCILCLCAALYLQIVEEMAPCPLCIIQRYIYALIAILCLLGAFLPTGVARVAGNLAGLLALGGVGAAGWHIWVKAHPGTTCGVDPLETPLNQLPTAKLFPALFQVDGLCTTDYGTTLGLSVPQWSLLGFVLVSIVLLVALARQR
ncbi:disulfide bond formation protein B [Herbaspirillum sp. RTI4]|uniref:disulfide bond formation protein B n=1 Tax=Herbaspirillum sp. RTI4 TaxID=3048640 RepID=UPI002AB5C283|nr:disulfide bond formation protein B [Herbaspirillum sp. RTI4]MDY7576910.1 disulfide bond formation protein B [Herbaspirillum sp. RTI4]MEA9983219.1 disulfide bond formation protein B [Herbaspirillum sp. RTI4]